VAAKKISPADALKLVIETIGQLEMNEKHWVLHSAASLWTVALPAVGGAAPNPALTNGAAKAPAGAQQEAKTFMKEKDPKSETQRVACLAYFLANVRNTHAFKTADVKKLNTEAKGPTFNVARAVGNAANAKHGYLSSVGRGQKQITSHGEEIVEALPDAAKVKEVEAQRKRPKRGRRGKKRKSAK